MKMKQNKALVDFDVSKPWPRGHVPHHGKEAQSLPRAPQNLSFSPQSERTWHQGGRKWGAYSLRTDLLSYFSSDLRDPPAAGPSGCLNL